ncbi:hypothetical protein DW219_09940 [Desulfovibrio sp. AM18-2]|uniref:L,D-TPase catalytic domain-containing protein n=2 Tax=Desulfovibrio legallii TaxID=571438 RepID=A0A6H3F9D1_9BACT|nr:hypothetical protein DW219_09940 [Desulfovibrio sp. AM18-2]TBH80493.1 hypothetical protein EB812_04990 [Desulfovibrio legallii]
MTCLRSLPVRNWWPLRVEGAGCRLWGVALALLFCGAMTLARPALADNWQATLYNEGLPTHLVAVDKARQTFLFFEKKSPLKLKYTFPCTTGQLPGDKQVLNDLRTPEGVYFVEYKIASGLDFKEYGGIAYTLNYPNPVDKLRGKTGHGIWIHSKGFGIEPLSTRGCVAIGLDEIGEVGPQLTPGTAVVLAERLDEKSVPRVDDGTARQLRRLMQAWSSAWAARSRKFFDFYDAEAYSRAMPESFVAFRQNKERLFNILRFIKIYNRKIHVLEGPGYWVTWSEQLYTASNLSTEGIRRLYWQRGKDDKFRIVGMEWTPRDLGMRADFQKGRLVAEAPLQVVSDAGSEAPRPPRLDMPESAPEEAVAAASPAAVASPAASDVEKAPVLQSVDQSVAASAPKPTDTAADNAGKSSGEKAAARTLLALSEPLVPLRQTVPPPAEVNWGARPGMAAGKAAQPALPPQEAPQAVQPSASQSAPGAAVVPTGAAAPSVPTSPAAPAMQPQAAPAAPAQPQAAQTQSVQLPTLELSAGTRQALAAAVADWNTAFAARAARIADFYDQARYNREPGAPRGHSLRTTLRELERRFAAPWLTVINRKPDMEIKGGLAVTSWEQLVAAPEGFAEGVRTLWWRRGEDGGFRIVAAQFRPGPTGLAADYLDRVSDQASAALETWRKAWEAAQLDAYMDAYTSDAVQQGRRGAANIRRQKEQLWARVKPTLVRISGLRLVVDRAGLRADMTQVYADSAGHSDRGTKTLQLRFDGKRWRIAREDWAALPPAPQP